MKKEHGEHNKECCEALFKLQAYPDWVVTTAFYSAIHFVDYKIFRAPYPKISGVEVTNIIDAKNALNAAAKGNKRHSLHQTREHLVSVYLPEQVANYQFLDSTCRNARYINYKISPDKAAKCKQRLTQMVGACNS